VGLSLSNGLDVTRHSCRAIDCIPTLAALAVLVVGLVLAVWPWPPFGEPAGDVSRSRCFCSAWPQAPGFLRSKTRRGSPGRKDGPQEEIRDALCSEVFPG